MQILHLASLAQSQILKSQKKKEDGFSILKKSAPTSVVNRSNFGHLDTFKIYYAM